MDHKKKEALHAGFAITISILVILYLAYLAYASKAEKLETQTVEQALEKSLEP